jgi:hypothetical protein
MGRRHGSRCDCRLYVLQRTTTYQLSFDLASCPARTHIRRAEVQYNAATESLVWLCGCCPTLLDVPVRFPSYSYLILSGAGAMMYEDEADTLRGYQRALFKGSPEEQPEAHAKSSPITYVEDVAAPLLVIQGSNDTRCPPRPMEAYEAKMKAAGKSIEVQWFEAGHGSGDVALTIAQQESMMTFALGVLEEVVAPVAATASARL